MFEAHSQYPDQSELHSEFLAEPSHTSRIAQSTRHQCSLYQWWTCGKITLPSGEQLQKTFIYTEYRDHQGNGRYHCEQLATNSSLEDFLHQFDPECAEIDNKATQKWVNSLNSNYNL